MKNMTRHQLQRLIERAEGTPLIEVLDRHTFTEFHLPGAIHIPFAEEFDRRVSEAVSDLDAVVVVYGADEYDEIPVRAARRMEELGYREVHVYGGGKRDWRDAGLPIESASRGGQRPTLP